MTARSDALEEIICVPVRYPDGSVVFEPLRETKANPHAGTYVVTDRRRISRAER